MAEQEREDNLFRKARERAQSFIDEGISRVGDYKGVFGYNQLQFGEANLELKAWLGKDSYRTWEEQFNIFIKSLMRIDIPDYKAFADSISHRLDITEYNSNKEYVFSIRKKREKRNFEFLENLDSSVRRDTSVWWWLNYHPTHEVLFYLYSDDDQRVLSVTPFRSIDEDCSVLTKFLDGLEETFHAPWYPLDYDDRNVRQDVFEDAESYRLSILKGIAKVRNGISRKDESVYNDLWILAGHVSVCMYIRFEGYYEKKKQLLTEILADLIRIRGEGKASKYVMNRVNKYVVQNIAKKYIDTAWMHTRWLTNYIFAHLLDAEIDYPTYPKQRSNYPQWVERFFTPSGSLKVALTLSPFVFVWLSVIQPQLPSWMSLTPSWLSGFPSWLRLPAELVLLSGLGAIIALFYAIWLDLGRFIYIEVQKNKVRWALQQIIDDIYAGHYDSREVIRWLRQQERKGLHFHSLIYALLRLA